MRDNQMMANSRENRARSAFRHGAAAAALLAAFGVMSGVAQADYKIGLDAYRKGQYSVAVDLWKRYAGAGDVRAMKALGDYYSSCNPILNSNGQKIEAEKLDEYQDVEGLRWYTLAAYHDFKKQLRDDRKVKASERNAQIDARNCMPKLRERMSDAEVRQAEKLVTESLERGTERDIYAIADMYLRGAGVPKNTGKAYELFLVAATRGASEASGKLQHIEDNELLNKKGIEAAEKRAASWQPPLPEEHKGSTRQMAELDRLKKELEELRKQDALEAVSDIDVVAIQGALRALGFYLGPLDNKMGKGTREAVRRFQFSEALTETDVSPEKAELAKTGVLSAEDTVRLFERASVKADHGRSQYVYGVMFARGIGVISDGDKATKWLKIAADKNVALAHYALGVLYRDGTSGLNPVTPNKADAALHFAKARALGYGPAGRALELLEFEDPRLDDVDSPR